MRPTKDRNREVREIRVAKTVKWGTEVYGRMRSERVETSCRDKSSSEEWPSKAARSRSIPGDKMGTRSGKGGSVPDRTVTLLPAKL
jgi:hypothetical protein